MSTSAASGTTAPQSVREVDAVVVGAGFGGLYMVHRLQEMGLTVHHVQAAESGADHHRVDFPNGLRCGGPARC